MNSIKINNEYEFVVTEEMADTSNAGWSRGIPSGTVQTGFIKDEPDLFDHHMKSIMLTQQVDDIREQRKKIENKLSLFLQKNNNSQSLLCDMIEEKFNAKDLYGNYLAIYDIADETNIDRPGFPGNIEILSLEDIKNRIIAYFRKTELSLVKTFLIFCISDGSLPDILF